MKPAYSGRASEARPATSLHSLMLDLHSSVTWPARLHTTEYTKRHFQPSEPLDTGKDAAYEELTAPLGVPCMGVYVS